MRIKRPLVIPNNLHLHTLTPLHLIMQATDVLAGNISLAGQEWNDTPSFRIDFRKSPPHSLIEHWSVKIESIVTTVSEKADQLTREETVNFGDMLEEYPPRLVEIYTDTY